MKNLDATLLATTALAVGPWLYYRGFRTLRTRRLIANTPTARIRSMAMGLVEVKGVVEPRSTVRAPFSDRACAYWEVDIAARGRRGWRTIHRSQSGNPFYLSDDTGVALVYPHGAEGRLRNGTEETCAGIALPPCYATYMKEHTSLLARLARVGELRFRERILAGGQHVYVLGTAVPRARARVVAEGEELAATGTDGPPAIRLASLDRHVAAVVRRGENEPTFLISEDSERGLLLSLGARAVLELAGGPALTLAGLGWWLMTFSSGRMPW